MATIPQHARERPDEGYSEGPDTSLSESGGQMQLDMVDANDNIQKAQGELLAMSSRQQSAAFVGMMDCLSPEERLHLFDQLTESLPEQHKYDLVNAVIASLPTSAVARIYDAFHHRLHIDPTERLPMELTELIMLHLQPIDVVRCSMASHTWRGRALDSAMWRTFFLREGWMVDASAIEDLLKSENKTAEDGARSHRRKHEASVEARRSRKRPREASRTDVGVRAAHDTRDWNEQHGQVEADEDNQMEGVETSTAGRSTLADTDGLPSLSPPSSGSVTPYDGPLLREDILEQHIGHYDMFPPLSPPAVLGKGNHKFVNWHYLYKQRKRLEGNWNEGRYKSFQLPHPGYPDEMHEECVYTIHFSRDYLVSGSRDKSIKVWDLNTQRCLRTFAGQHEQSVLCLQFDPEPEENLIISGGSDSYVVVWNFTTGEVIKKMTDAHRESVLNLRFDKRYLITCSKDKTIKIWNRHKIRSDDPIVPQITPNQYPAGEPVEIEPYTLLGTLQGHNAAVNAIQIHENKIVSASGDRTIRMWDVISGQCIGDFQGHSKGIACVQYDGRRVVSGSSDNSVRIFDARTRGEVAVLQGHSALVRTLQVRFGDKTMTDEELEALAKQTQDRWAKNLDNLSQLTNGPQSRHGLDQIHDVRSLNAKIPQGGGGSRWSRIVSGSYDETVIIWKKDADGKWIVGRRLHQDEVLSHPRNRNRGQRAPVPQQPGPGNAQQQGAQAPQVHAHGQAGQAGPQAGPAGPAHVPGHAQMHAPPPHHGQHVHHHHHHAPHAPNAGAPNAAAQANAGQRQQQMNAYLAQQRTAAFAPARQQTTQQRAAAVAAAQHALARRAQGAVEESSNRVFKLQFDTRRIICCSQNKVIVGWDFANGDEDLIEASRFFAETD
ncbi:F-box/WD repeat-containing protein pof11 [Sphaceloma murrayae]|uniref:F-box/WD repeat-containing protein pof11 n=1 Tax=Sphaceloma murrayae TaxID=2082308 RepID=A0A2K1R0T4_9PEZI|nr:F-box/WD repeat-containing protein pof11 [Sphaceloma murrayae]